MNLNKENKYPEIRFKGFTEAWEQRKWNTVMKINSGKDYKHLSHGEVPVYGTGGYMLSVNEALSNVDSIGIGRKGTIDKSQYLAAPFWTVDTLFYMTPLQEFDIKFLYSLSQQINWKKLDESTGVPSLSKINIEKITQYFPNTEEQLKIGEFFDQLENTIALHQDKLDKLKSLKKAYLRVLFPEKEERSPKLRFANFCAPWEQRKLGKVAKVYDGTHQTPKYTNSGIMFLSVENIHNLNSKKFISKQAFEKEFKVRPEKGDILMTRIGSIGVANIVNNDTPVAYYVSLALIKSEFNPYFLKTSIHSPFVQDELWKKTLHIAFPKKINKNEITKVILKFPSLEEQFKIGKFSRNLDDIIALHQQKLDKLTLLKKSYLKKMFI